MLRLHSVSKSYNGRVILRGMDFSLSPGELILLSGPNGAGKSTLLRLVAGFASPDQGEVVRSRLAQNTGYLGHESFLYPGLSAWENLRLWLGLYRCSATTQQIMHTLEELDLLPFAEEKVRHFSKGMLQKLAIARILLQRPSLLLLDEPLNGLDPATAALCRNRLLDLKYSGSGLLWVSHFPEDELHQADRLLLLSGKGRHEFLPGGAEPYEPEPLPEGTGLC